MSKTLDKLVIEGDDINKFKKFSILWLRLARYATETCLEEDDEKYKLEIINTNEIIKKYFKDENLDEDDENDLENLALEYGFNFFLEMDSLIGESEDENIK